MAIRTEGAKKGKKDTERAKGAVSLFLGLARKMKRNIDV